MLPTPLVTVTRQAMGYMFSLHIPFICLGGVGSVCNTHAWAMESLIKFLQSEKGLSLNLIVSYWGCKKASPCY